MTAVLSGAVLAILTSACGQAAPPPAPPPTPVRESPSPPPPAPTPTGMAEATPTVAPDLPPEAAQGMEVADREGCLGCHTTDGTTLVGPTWQGLFGKTEQLEGGDTVVVDESYIEESIRNPGAKVVQGFDNIMPAFPDLPQEDVNAVIAYIRSLE